MLRGRERRKPVDYIDKKEFSKKIEEYVLECQPYIDKKKDPPMIPDDIAKGFLLICENLSHSRNFVNYTYREDMVMDAVENCVKAVHKFNPNAKTKSGKPNAFSYFTRIAWNAMVRRIKKEKQDTLVKEAILQQSTPLDFVVGEDDMTMQYIETMISNNLKDER